MSDSQNNEIDIPEPINKPKGKPTAKAEHPTKKSKVDVQPKPVLSAQPMSKKSRFEPEAVPVEVPSRGILYKGRVNDEEVANGVIRIRPMTLAEEKIITTDRLIQSGKALDMILENCVKSDIDSYELLSSDRLYILFYLRGMSYGLEYDFAIRCYHCGFNFEQTIEIDKLPVKTWDDPEDGSEPITMTLPQTGFEVEAHFMRGKDESRLAEASREMRNFNQADDDIGQAITLLITQVTTDEGEVLSPRDKIDFINHMPAGDADFFREVLREKDCGIQMLDHIYCPRCNGELEFNVPLGRNFFRRSRR